MGRDPQPNTPDMESDQSADYHASQDNISQPFVTYGRVGPEFHPAFGRRAAVFNWEAIAKWAAEQKKEELQEGSE